MAKPIFSRGRLVVLTLLALFVLPNDSLAQERLFMPLLEGEGEETLNAEQKRLLRTFKQRIASVHVELVRIGDLLPAFGRGTLLINLPDRREEFIAEKTDEEHDPPYYLWSGIGRLLSGEGNITLVGIPGELEFTGIIHLVGDQWYQIEPLGDGLHALITVDATKLSFEGDTPPEFPVLNKAYPNPFNSSTAIAYSLPESGDVKLVVYDVLGREVARLVDGYRGAGYHRVVFDAPHLYSGVYFYRLQTGSFVASRQVTFLK